MMKTNLRPFRYAFAFLLGVTVMVTFNCIQARAVRLSDYGAGIASLLDPSSLTINGIEQLADPSVINSIEPVEEKSTLVMANVNNAVNVRAEATEDSEKVGVLYKDCGGRIVENGEGWTKISSGDLEGWVRNDYLLFEDDAVALAEKVGVRIVTVESDALRVRKEPSLDAGVYGLVACGDELDVVETVSDEWVSVDYEGETGYLSAQYVSVDFHIDAGETVEAIKQRQKEEAERKAKEERTKNQGAVIAGADEARLLAALIQCEAGGEPFEGQLAVGAVVMNRVRSGGYPNTITEVIYASGQFTPARSGKLAARYNGNIKDSCIQAAQQALAGETNVGTATHFRRVGYTDGIVIGHHVFW